MAAAKTDNESLLQSALDVLDDINGVDGSAFRYSSDVADDQSRQYRYIPLLLIPFDDRANTGYSITLRVSPFWMKEC